MTFFDPFMVGIEQYRPDFPWGCKMPFPVKGHFIPVKDRKIWIFEYDFYYMHTDRKYYVYVGEKTLEEGSYQWFNAFHWYLDPELRYRVTLSLNAMLENVTVNVKEENHTLKELLESVPENFVFRWLIYGQYNHPLKDEILNWEILTDRFPFLKATVKPTQLKTGDKFKILFELTKPSLAFDPKVSFGIKGRARRSGELNG